MPLMPWSNGGDVVRNVDAGWHPRRNPLGVPLMAFGLTALLFCAATLYSAVGHAGASGYLAAMALFGVSPAVMKPAALCLNILVSSMVTLRFARAGLLPWRQLWPFALGSVPLAFFGGTVQLTAHIYRPLLGCILVITAVRMLVAGDTKGDRNPQPPPLWLALATGAGIGLLAGLTGTGGGIFLSPLLLLAGWATTRQAAGLAAAFIWLNSVAGLAGTMATVGQIPADIVWWAAAVIAGGMVGSELATKRLPPDKLRKVLAVVLAIAGIKLVAV